MNNNNKNQKKPKPGFPGKVSQKNKPKAMGKKPKKEKNKITSYPRPLPESVYAQNVSRSVSQVMGLYLDAYYAVGWNLVVQSLARGWLANAPSPDYPTAAYRYITDLWGQFANAAIPPSTSLPYWMWALGRSISPKTVRFDQGDISYKYDQAVGSNSGSNLQIGPIAYGYLQTLYVPSPTLVDGFPVAVAPTVTTSPQIAFQSLIAYAETEKTRNSQVSGPCPTVFDRDVSSFAQVFAASGGGYKDYGGVGYSAGLEVPIHTPLLTAFAPPIGNSGDLGQSNRFSSWVTQFGGDSMYSAACLSTLLPVHLWKTKIRPKFKFIDFLEMGEVIALWASKIVTQWWSDQMGVIAEEVITLAPVTAQCPITLQEMQLLLRNEVLALTVQCQIGTQGLYPIRPQTPSDKEFIAFGMGSNTVPLGLLGMKLPQPFVENMKALIQRVAINGRDIECIVPVIGQYYGDVLSTSDYKFQYDTTTGGLFNTFTSDPPTKKRSMVKGVETWITTSEVPIDFVSGFAGNDYLFINDVTRLKKLCSLWNDWVSTYQTYSSPLSTCSIEPGVLPLMSVADTLAWYIPTPTTQARDSAYRDERFTAGRYAQTSQYSNRQAVAITYRSRPISEVTKITDMWILPVQKLSAGFDPGTTSTYVKTQELNRETYARVLSATGDSGETMASRHASYAAAMVHAKGGEASIDKIFSSLESEGKGGILSSLAAQFIGSAFGSTAGQIAGAVADILPI